MGGGMGGAHGGQCGHSPGPSRASRQLSSEEGGRRDEGRMRDEGGRRDEGRMRDEGGRHGAAQLPPPKFSNVHEATAYAPHAQSAALAMPQLAAPGRTGCTPPGLGLGTAEGRLSRSGPRGSTWRCPVGVCQSRHT